MFMALSEKASEKANQLQQVAFHQDYCQIWPKRKTEEKYGDSLFVKHEEHCSNNQEENQCENEYSGKKAESIDKESFPIEHSLHPTRRTVFRFMADRFGDVANAGIEN